MRRLILRADFRRGRRVLLNAIAGGTAPDDSIWAGNSSLKAKWKKSFVDKWKSQEQSKRQQFRRLMQPTIILPDIRRWTEDECIAYSLSFGGIDCILGVDLGVIDWSHDRLTGYDGKHKPGYEMTDADWANLCFYQSESVLFLHKATYQ